MGNRYVVTGARPVADVAPGDTGDFDLTAEDEHNLLTTGRLALVPREYRVTGTNPVCDTAPGGVFTAAFTVGQEAALISAGHIERHDPPRKASGKPKAESGPESEGVSTNG